MAVFKRGKRWWYEFKFGGVRYRQSCHTTDEDLALAMESQRRQELEYAQLKQSPVLQALLPDLRSAQKKLNETIEHIQAGEAVQRELFATLKAKPRKKKQSRN